MWIALRDGHSLWRMDLAEGILHHVAGTGQPGYAGDGGPAKLARFHGPKGIAIDCQNNLFVVDSENNAVRKIDLASDIVSTIARGNQPGARQSQPDGAQAEKALLNQPHGVCVGRNGEVYVGDTLNHVVRRVK
jgi:hypothetical protein